MIRLLLAWLFGDKARRRHADQSTSPTTWLMPVLIETLAHLATLAP
jgi:hypothetical protein